MKKSQLLFTIFCFIILSNQAFSAELPTTKYGFTAAYDRIIFNADELNYRPEPLYLDFNSISGNGISIGAILLTPVNLFSNDFFQSRLRMSFNYDYFFNINSSPIGDSYASLILENGEIYAPQRFAISYFLEKDYSRINLEIQYSLKIPKIGLIFNLGPSIYYTTTTNEIRKAIISDGKGRLDTISSILDFPIKNEVIRFENNYQTAVYRDGPDKSLDGFAFGFSGGIAYEFNLGSITLSPGINYKYQKFFQNLLFTIDVLF